MCRAAAGACDIAETCDGSATACPADLTSPDTDADTVCDILDNCDGIANAGQTDGDGDLIGDACDACTGGGTATKARLSAQKLLVPTGDDKLGFSGTVTLPTSPAIDPITKGMGVIVTTVTNDSLLDVAVPGGAFSKVTRTGWKVNGAGTRWTYKNGAPNTANPVQIIVLSTSPRTPGVFKFKVKAKNGAFPTNLADVPLRATLVVDAPFAATGQCGEVGFPSAASCKFNPSQSSVSCK